MLTIIFDRDGKTATSNDPSIIPALLEDESMPFWVDLEAPTQEEFKILEQPFAFHRLAIEEAQTPSHYAKVEEFDTYLFLTLDEVSLNLDISSPASKDLEAEDRVVTRAMGVFLGKNYLVTIHVDPIVIIKELTRSCDKNHRVLEHGADYLLYNLMDTLVDGYFPMMESLDGALDDLEDRIVGKSTPGTLQTIFTMKRVLNLLRRHVGPAREVLQLLSSREFPCISDKSLPYFRSVADHLFRIYESLDNYRDVMSSMLDAYLTQVSNDMNRVMQKLSAVATVFLPITFITSLFGMNFAKQPWIYTNFWFWVAAMVVVAVLTYIWFRKHKWV
jgi:magnesium transporter